MFASPKLRLDSSNHCSRPKFVTVCIVIFKYLKMLPKSDQMFQKSYLRDIEADWVAQSLWEKTYLASKMGKR
jgi:hypothetical protein